MKLLVDMNLSPRWIGVLADGGIEAAHWSSLGANNAPDAEIMAYANTNNYVVLTHDLDFGTILAATQGKKPSVVQIRAEDVSPNVIGVQVIAALRQMAEELEDGALLTVDVKRTRLRLLPLQWRGWHEVYIANRRATLEEDVKYFSAESKADREKWVVREFLRILGVQFNDEEIAPAKNDPPDVIFRGAPCVRIVVASSDFS
ncbi:DUF5615 family PIN-like protein [Rugamonas sp. CCM 8940]|uniref:DUF5615 family PIN-like protein n=1 Tax=Rugamonas sp. CCM 8940 TaxID=2765359 RepID=UPI0018F4CEBF|nr:DUF5615 family PIN-like protein [Rugamonas sp. CCM 8940]MBJ7311001.1 DUF5615 family PIN-like protein [Rugamonas sp. CCM 8940]